MKKIVKWSVVATIGLVSLGSVIGPSDCAQPAPVGKCGLASEGPSCANGCVSTTGGQTDIKNCTGPDGTKRCQYNTINWSGLWQRGWAA